MQNLACRIQNEIWESGREASFFCTQKLGNRSTTYWLFLYICIRVGIYPLQHIDKKRYACLVTWKPEKFHEWHMDGIALSRVCVGRYSRICVTGFSGPPSSVWVYGSTLLFFYSIVVRGLQPIKLLLIYLSFYDVSYFRTTSWSRMSSRCYSIRKEGARPIFNNCIDHYSRIGHV